MGKVIENLKKIVSSKPGELFANKQVQEACKEAIDEIEFYRNWVDDDVNYFWRKVFLSKTARGDTPHDAWLFAQNSVQYYEEWWQKRRHDKEEP